MESKAQPKLLELFMQPLSAADAEAEARFARVWPVLSKGRPALIDTLAWPVADPLKLRHKFLKIAMGTLQLRRAEPPAYVGPTLAELVSTAVGTLLRRMVAVLTQGDLKVVGASWGTDAIDIEDERAVQTVIDENAELIEQIELIQDELASILEPYVAVSP